MKYFESSLGLDHFNSNVRTRKNGKIRIIFQSVFNNFSAYLYSWSSSMPKDEIWHGIAPVTEKGFGCFHRTDCVTDLNQCRDLSLQTSVHSVPAVAVGACLASHREESVEVTQKRALQSSLVGCPQIKHVWALSRTATCFTIHGWCGTQDPWVTLPIPRSSHQSRGAPHRKPATNPWNCTRHFLLPHHHMLAQVPASLQLVSSSLGCLWDGWRTALYAPKERDPELGLVECDVLRAHIAPVCRCQTVKAVSQGAGRSGKRLSLRHGAVRAVERRTPAPQHNPSPLHFCLQGLAAVSATLLNGEVHWAARWRQTYAWPILLSWVVVCLKHAESWRAKGAWLCVCNGQIACSSLNAATRARTNLIFLTILTLQLRRLKEAYFCGQLIFKT